MDYMPIINSAKKRRLDSQKQLRTDKDRYKQPYINIQENLS